MGAFQSGEDRTKIYGSDIRFFYKGYYITKYLKDIYTVIAEVGFEDIVVNKDGEIVYYHGEKDLDEINMHDA
ncbi:MAG: hypothetical protein ACK5HP_04660 [Bacilli bacterium]